MTSMVQISMALKNIRFAPFINSIAIQTLFVGGNNMCSNLLINNGNGQNVLLGSFVIVQRSCTALPWDPVKQFSASILGSKNLLQHFPEQ